MIHDLDATIAALIDSRAPVGSALAGATLSFDLPDATWRGALAGPAISAYLFDLRENTAQRHGEEHLQRNADGTRAARRRPLARMDCAYLFTAWSSAQQDAALEEHRLLGELAVLLLRWRTLPPDVLRGGLVAQRTPYPALVAGEQAPRLHESFWNALDHPVKPALVYVITVALVLDDEPVLGPGVAEVRVGTDAYENRPQAG